VDLDLCVAQGAGYVLYLLYSYESTHAVGRRRARGDGYALYLLYWYGSTHTDAAADSAAAYCRRYALYLLYWYESTHTDATADSAAAYCRRYALYLLYWYESTHTDAPPPALSYLALSTRDLCVSRAGGFS
jgi:hypothetical protein